MLKSPVPYFKDKKIEPKPILLLGQDPNISKTREVKTCLDLDNLKGPLRKYIIETICFKLSIGESTIFSWNICNKYYPKKPDKKTLLVDFEQSEHVQLEEKLEKFHPKLIISFGQQTYEILRMFYKLYNLPNYLRDIFGYNAKDSIPQIGEDCIKKIKILNLDYFLLALPHINSYRKHRFYRNLIDTLGKSCLKFLIDKILKNR